jgi:hypothetical protein
MSSNGGRILTQRWKRLSRAWVRTPNLFIEHCDTPILFKIGNHIGHPIRDWEFWWPYMCQLVCFSSHPLLCFSLHNFSLLVVSLLWVLPSLIRFIAWWIEREFTWPYLTCPDLGVFFPNLSGILWVVHCSISKKHISRNRDCKGSEW